MKRYYLGLLKYYPNAKILLNMKEIKQRRNWKHILQSYSMKAGS